MSISMKHRALVIRKIATVFGLYVFASAVLQHRWLFIWLYHWRILLGEWHLSVFAPQVIMQIRSVKQKLPAAAFMNESFNAV
jgi:hypothetical protein